MAAGGRACGRPTRPSPTRLDQYPGTARGINCFTRGPGRWAHCRCPFRGRALVAGRLAPEPRIAALLTTPGRELTGCSRAANKSVPGNGVRGRFGVRLGHVGLNTPGPARQDRPDEAAFLGDAAASAMTLSIGNGWLLRIAEEAASQGCEAFSRLMMAGELTAALVSAAMIERDSRA